MMDHQGFRSIAVTFIAGMPSIFYWAIGIWILCTLMALITPFGFSLLSLHFLLRGLFRTPDDTGSP